MNIIDVVGLIIAKLTYGHDIVMRRIHGTKFLCMPAKFIRMKVDKVIDVNEGNEMMKDFDLSQFKVFNVDNYSIMYFDQPVKESYITDYDIYRKELTEIFNILSKYFPGKEIARKYHPHHPSDKAMLKIGDILPDFIPAEFLYDENVKMYLSLFSDSLAHVEKGLAVSIVDLITPKNNGIRQQLKDNLINKGNQRHKGGSRILFPESLEEFEQIVVGINRAQGSAGK